MDMLECFDVSVRGLGFTGLATAVGAARAGLRVVGLDDSGERVRQITRALPGCGLGTVCESELRAQLAGKTLTIRDTSGPAPVAGIHVICVPTPAGNSDGADLSALTRALDSVAPALRDGDLVLVQSTCPPGTTEHLVRHRLAARSGVDWHLAYSPVRLAPGAAATLRDVPRVVAGMTPAATDLAVRFLRRVTDHVVPVSSVRVAELVKVFENTFRLVNISLANELGEFCRESDVDVHEVVAAAATKPYGFLPHQPGPGAGGDCVPVSAGFFAAVARRAGVPSAIVDAAVALNDAMPAIVVRRIERLLAAHRMAPLAGRRILVAGVTYKPDVANVRRSAAVRVIEHLRRVADVAHHDPYVPELRLPDGTVLHATTADRHTADLVLVLTRHRAVAGPAVGADVPVVDCTGGTPTLLEVLGDAH
ncbi:MAG TPA: nucleotide sugar dehydrogenase [Pseudonocardiaceae bacterium]|nr:nucleotide sugar dehydrogenase [Pseudonocardiaceae bacterium]